MKHIFVTGGVTSSLGKGIISASLYQKKLNQSFHLSDLDLLAVKRAKKNLESIKANFTIKQGNLFEPWKKQKFDLLFNEAHKENNKNIIIIIKLIIIINVNPPPCFKN